MAIQIVPLIVEVINLLGTGTERNSGWTHLPYHVENVLWSMIVILFCVAFIFILSLALDKIDQLVWLNASDEDREEILAKRKKKNA